ncbi:ABC transporter permease [Pelagibacterales bacterium SAG-MED32]|nr:ABC transporter permease [Pelagibacterales bacterium SAG-MED32]
MNFYAIRAIYFHEMDRMRRTIFQSILSPVISTSLYFIVFGSVIGGMIPQIDGVSYGSFIVPGLLMLTLLTQSISNSAFGIFFPKFTGSVYEVLAAPISSLEIIIGFVGASASKSLIVGVIILLTASFFVELQIQYPLLMLFLLILTCLTFILFSIVNSFIHVLNPDTNHIFVCDYKQRLACFRQSYLMHLHHQLLNMIIFFQNNLRGIRF